MIAAVKLIAVGSATMAKVAKKQKTKKTKAILLFLFIDELYLPQFILVLDFSRSYRIMVYQCVTCVHVPVTVYRNGVQDFLCLV